MHTNRYEWWSSGGCRSCKGSLHLRVRRRAPTRNTLRASRIGKRTRLACRWSRPAITNFSGRREVQRGRVRSQSCSRLALSRRSKLRSKHGDRAPWRLVNGPTWLSADWWSKWAQSAVHQSRTKLRLGWS